ncbi:hypothetical protein [Pedobacter gandavensis]|uniref:hypothetical protein n=1 Tax=Pedobacter gandavensis TaxID=2679963 RepID=UPI0029302D43|nr:hypothetical protein [Pedobacter gandavensis]
MPSKRSDRSDPAYLREQGKREANVKHDRKITFALELITVSEGQTWEQWEKLGHLSTLMTRLQFVGQFSCQEALRNSYIKRYTKVGYPPRSGFTQPKHITAEIWAVMHITGKSKEVVAGYVEDDVFHIIFLDKDHKFWPMGQ